ncbi:hypothetical protein GCM10017688_37170 [Streptomyces ramulosus]
MQGGNGRWRAPRGPGVHASGASADRVVPVRGGGCRTELAPRTDSGPHKASRSAHGRRPDADPGTHTGTGRKTVRHMTFPDYVP